MKFFYVMWLWHTLRASYWFIPSLMVVTALLLSLLTSQVDMRLGGDWLRGIDILFDNRPEGARAVLSAIAGSMITVAGVTFSMTVVSVSFAAAQFGPRLVGNFMRDTGNQVSLGVFIATFVYCLVALRTVRSADVADNADALAAFVPHLTVLVALLLALACVVVLIYYIHHVPETINIANITAAVGRQLNRHIEDHFVAPEAGGTARTNPDRQWAMRLREVSAVCAERDGYVQFIDLEAITACAADHDLLVRLRAQAGDFVSRGDTLLDVSCERALEEEVASELRCHFQFGRERTPDQDILFLVDELVEILARALSPGQNDPFTAIGCMNWLRGALLRVAERRAASALRYDDQGGLRLIAPTIGFEQLATAVFDQSLPYVCRDRNAALKLMDVIRDVVARASDPQVRATLIGHGERLELACSEHLSLTGDRQEIRARLAAMKTTAQVAQSRRDSLPCDGV